MKKFATVIMLCLAGLTLICGCMKTSTDSWRVFSLAANHFKVSFPNEVKKVGSGATVQYISKNSIGNLYAAQRFVPEIETIRGQSSKDMLRTAIKVLVMKHNIKLDETTYTEYLRETVAVDFSGQITNQPSADRPFKGKIILDNNSFYYIYSILKTNNQKNLENYEKFVRSFQITE